jgi:hypothetical protein
MRGRSRPRMRRARGHVPRRARPAQAPSHRAGARRPVRAGAPVRARRLHRRRAVRRRPRRPGAARAATRAAHAEVRRGGKDRDEHPAGGTHHPGGNLPGRCSCPRSSLARMFPTADRFLGALVPDPAPTSHGAGTASSIRPSGSPTSQSTRGSRAPATFTDSFRRAFGMTPVGGPVPRRDPLRNAHVSGSRLERVLSRFRPRAPRRRSGRFEGGEGMRLIRGAAVGLLVAAMLGCEPGVRGHEVHRAGRTSCGR